MSYICKVIILLLILFVGFVFYLIFLSTINYYVKISLFSTRFIINV